MRRWVGLGLIFLACAVLILSCSEKGGGLRFTNIPPETFITYGPSWKDTTEFRVHLYWYGKDVDGEVSYFEVATIRDLDSLESCWSGESIRWGRTTSGESTFILAANSKIVADTANLSPFIQVNQATPWAVLVRAIDNDGEADPCPASAFFIASTAIPQVKIKVPGYGTLGKFVQPVAYFEWEGKDPDGVEEYLKYKYLVIEADSVETNKKLDVSKIPPFTRESQTDQIGRWSKWIPSDSTKVVGYDLSAHKGRSFYLFVTAMDEAGGYIPIGIFGKYDSAKCLSRFTVSTTAYGCPPVVDVGFLGQYRTTPKTPIYAFQGTKVKLIFWAEENRGQGQLTDVYRYYFDYEDNTDPQSRWIWTKVTDRNIGAKPEWVVRVPQKGGKHVEWVLDTPGPHQFVVQTRDLVGTEKTLTLSLDVLGGPDPTKRRIFFVDDSYQSRAVEPRPIDYDSNLKAFWKGVLEGFPYDVLDTGQNYANDVRKAIDVLGKATTVIWNVDFDLENPATQLLKTCTEYGAFLHSYVKLGGNVIIIGQDPIYDCCYWPDKTIIAGDPTTGPSRRSDLPRNLDFIPTPTVSGDTLYNFLWDVFGIKTVMRDPNELRKFIPCAGSSPDWQQDTIDVDMSKVGMRVLSSPYYITQFRMPTDKEYPFRTTPELMFSTIGVDDKGRQVNKCGSFIGIYVPAAQGYGHAAYLAVDPYWVDQEKLKQVIWKLLDKFGETRQQP